MSADATLAAITRDQWNHYLQQFAPLENELVGDVNSRDLVTKAAKTAATQTRVGDASLDRSISRYGLNMTGVQRAQLERQQAIGNATNTAQAVNTARVDQRDRNLSLAANLMQQGRGVSSSAISGLGDAANSEAQRNAHNAQAKAQAKAQQTSTAIGIVGLGIMAF